MHKVKAFYAKHPILSHFLLIVATGFIILWGVLLYLDHWTQHGQTAIVPDIRHKSYAEARSVLQANGLSIEIADSVYDRSLAPGTVMESNPRAGAVVKKDRQVYVTVTAFSPKQVTISMPLTGNVSSRQAMSYLRGIGITDIRIESVPSDYADLVVGARYGDTPLKVGSVIPVTSTVTLQVGSGPAADSGDADEADSLGLEEDADIEEYGSIF